MIRDADLPGLFDYRCQLSLAEVGCSFSVFDEQEAEVACDTDLDCKAFVLTDVKTWTGNIYILKESQ